MVDEDRKRSSELIEQGRRVGQDVRKVGSFLCAVRLEC